MTHKRVAKPTAAPQAAAAPGREPTLEAQESEASPELAFGLAQVGAYTGQPAVQRTEAPVPDHPQGLPPRMRRSMESMAGIPMHDVRVRRNSSRPSQLGALAFAQGTEIHLAPGQDQHLPHEAWHVVQQKQGRVKPTSAVSGVSINDDDKLEREADAMGNRSKVWTGKARAVVSQPTHTPGSAMPVQRKVGVEYETNWKVTGDNRSQHKKPILSSKGWHLESDNNNLEFVVFPPATSPETLEAMSGEMSKTAVSIRNRAGEFLDSTVGDILPSSKAPFRDQHFTASSDDAMSAKAQFTFGISMGNLTKLFDGIDKDKQDDIRIPGGDGSFNFQKPSLPAKTTKDFLGTGVKGALADSSELRTQAQDLARDQSPEMQGFLSYLAYYVKSMEAEYESGWSPQLGDTKFMKAAHLAEAIAKGPAKPIADALGDGSVTAGRFNTMVETLKEYQWRFADEDDNGLLEGLSEKEVDLNTPANQALTVNELAYLEGFADRVSSNVMDYPKYRFVLMNRSGFDKMYQALSKEDRTWFKSNLPAVMHTLGKEPGDRLFASPYTYKKKNSEGQVTDKGISAGPTVKAWLDSIVASTPKKRDELSPPKEFIMENGKPDPDQSMGLLGFVDTSEITSYSKSKSGAMTKNVKRVQQTVIELRQWGDYIKPEHWAKHSYDMAYLFGKIATGDLNFDAENKIEELLIEKANLQSQIQKIDSSLRGGQKTNVRLMNRGLRNKIAAIDFEIQKLRRIKPSGH